MNHVPTRNVSGRNQSHSKQKLNLVVNGSRSTKNLEAVRFFDQTHRTVRMRELRREKRGRFRITGFTDLIHAVQVILNRHMMPTASCRRRSPQVRKP
jgi:hypothetical protein